MSEVWSRLVPAAASLETGAFLYDRLRIDCALRLAVAATIVVGTFLAVRVFGLVGLDQQGLLVSASVITAYNVLTFLLIRRFRSPPNAERRLPLLRALRHTTVLADYVALTVLVYLVGGARSPFLAVFLLHVVLNSVTLSRRSAYIHAFAAYALLASLVIGEWTGMLTPHLTQRAWSSLPLDAPHAWGLLVLYAILFVLISFMLTRLAQRLRAEQHKARTANAELERLSQSRRAYLLVVVHDLRSPISAVSMMLDTLETGMLGPLNERQHQMMHRSLARLRDCADLLRNYQSLAQLEPAEYRREVAPIDVRKMLYEVVEENRDLADQAHHTLHADAAEDLPPLQGVKCLLRQALANLLTNAIKYTPNGGRIVVRATHQADSVVLEVEDNGIGISPPDQERLFAEFTRIEHSDPEFQRVPGSGLGLSIAKRIVQAHGGTLRVRSAVSRGSTFTLELPAAAPPSAAR